MRLQQRVILITGGTGAIERRIAMTLGAEGASILIGAPDESAGQEIQADLDARGIKAVFIPCDPGDEAGIQALISEAVMSFGSLHGLVNSIAAPVDGDAIEVDGAAWDRALDGQVRGAWLACRSALPFLKQGRDSAIVNLIRSDALRTAPRSLLAATANGALDAMTRSLAIDFGPQGVRVNAIATGFIETDDSHHRLGDAEDGEFLRLMSMHPLGRLGRPGDVANAAMFLLGPESSFVTGTTLFVDGGRSVLSQGLFD